MTVVAFFCLRIHFKYTQKRFCLKLKGIFSSMKTFSKILKSHPSVGLKTFLGVIFDLGGTFLMSFHFANAVAGENISSTDAMAVYCGGISRTGKVNRFGQHIPFLIISSPECNDIPEKLLEQIAI